jgi:hypothetical protein
MVPLGKACKKCGVDQKQKSVKVSQEVTRMVLVVDSYKDGTTWQGVQKMWG